MASRLRIAVGGVEKDAEIGVRGEDRGRKNAAPRGEEGAAFEFVPLSTSTFIESTGRIPAIKRQ
jgi:hypothetical protein